MTQRASRIEARNQRFGSGCDEDLQQRELRIPRELREVRLLLLPTEIAFDDAALSDRKQFSRCCV
uniref:hypothetical protein n=1 Tax=Salmonella enterica TaxID=28901 RepID=UPI0032970073